MGIGIGGENWVTIAMRWFYGVDEKPAEMPVIYTQSEVDEIKSELVAEIDRLMLERKGLFTVEQVNRHAEGFSEQLRQRIRKLEETIQQTRNILGLSLSPVNRLDLNNAWHNSEKKSIPSIPPNGEPL